MLVAAIVEGKEATTICPHGIKASQLTGLSGNAL